MERFRGGKRRRPPAGITEACEGSRLTLRFLPVFPDPDVDGQRNLQRSRRLHSVAHDRGERVGPALRHLEQQLVVNRSEEHTSELQSPCNLVCRLLLEKKKKKK